MFSIPADLVDISLGGAGFEVRAGAVASGGRVRINFGAETLEGRVVWAEGSRCGVRFASELSEFPVRLTDDSVMLAA